MKLSIKNIAILLIIVFINNSLAAQKAAFDSVVNEYHNKKGFNGTIVVVDKQGKPWMKAVGERNRSAHQMHTLDSKFRILSFTKAFAAILVMKLWEQGKIDVEAAIGTYFPEYTGAGKSKVTIHQLLTYSSGIEDPLSDAGVDPYVVKKSLDAFIKEYCSGKLVREPGTESVYGNVEYILLQKVLEKQSRLSFEQLLKKEILQPLQMNSTGISRPEVEDKHWSKGYIYNDSTKTFTPETKYVSENFFAAGSMYSTVSDLLKLDRALFGGELLGKKALEKLLTINEKLGYTAYGFWGSTGWGNFKEPFYYRTGGMEGSTSNWIHATKSGVTIIVLCNNDGVNLYEMSEQLYLEALR